MFLVELNIYAKNTLQVNRDAYIIDIFIIIIILLISFYFKIYVIAYAILIGVAITAIIYLLIRNGKKEKNDGIEPKSNNSIPPSPP